MSAYTVSLESAYSDGHRSKREVLLPAPAGDQSLDDWFEEVVFPETGDGHGADNRLGSCLTATVTACDVEAHLGAEREWVD